MQDTVIEEDKEFVSQYFDMPDTDFADMERMSPWLLRIELNREMLTDKGLNMSRIADTITSEFGDEMSVIFTDDNAPKHILRVSSCTPCLAAIVDNANFGASTSLHRKLYSSLSAPYSSTCSQGACVGSVDLQEWLAVHLDSKVCFTIPCL